MENEGLRPVGLVPGALVIGCGVPPGTWTVKMLGPATNDLSSLTVSISVVGTQTYFIQF